MMQQMEKEMNQLYQIETQQMTKPLYSDVRDVNIYLLIIFA